MKYSMHESVEILHQHYQVVGLRYDPITNIKSYELIDHKGHILKNIPEYSLALSVTPEMIKEQGEK